MRKLPREFYAGSTALVARSLLGKLLVHHSGDQARVARITEVEAYLGAHDKAAHSSRGVTPRTQVMFGEPGHAYVYLVYGMHHCMNVVTEPAGHGSAVLVRAVQPLSGITGNTLGPGLLCKAMDIDLRCNRADLCGHQLYIAEDGYEVRSILATPRIGVDYAGDWADALLRFVEDGNAWVSGRKSRPRRSLPDNKEQEHP